MSYAAIVPIMFEPTTGLPVVLCRTFVQRTMYGHSFSLCDAFSCTVPWNLTPEQAVAKSFSAQAPEIVLDPPVPSSEDALVERLVTDRLVCKVQLVDCVVFVVRAKWNTSFVPMVKCTAAENLLLQPVFATRDVHGKGRTFLMNVLDKTTGEVNLGLRFITQDRSFVQCLTLSTIAQSLECRDRQLPPFLPSGVFYVVTTLLKCVVENICLYLNSKDIDE